MKTILATGAFLLGLSSSVAHAQSYNACKKLEAADAKACQAAAHAQCGALDGYWPKQKCADKVAVSFDPCTKGDAFEQACTPQKAKFHEYCMKAGDLDLNKAESVEKFKQRAMAYPKVMKELEAFNGQWKACYGHTAVPTCQFSSGDLSQCKRAESKYKKTFSEAVDFYLSTYQQNLANADAMLRASNFQAAKGMADISKKTLIALQSINAAVPALAHRSKDVDTALKTLDARKKSIDAAYAKTLAKVRCPKAKKGKKGMAQSVSEFFGKSPGKKVKSFGLKGKMSKSYDRFRKEATESYPGIACTEKKTSDTQLCQVFSISVKRKKIDKQPWGPWLTYVGSSKEMLCKNLK